MEDDIKTFLTPHLTSQTKPTITLDYAKSFNHVDRLNKVRSYVHYRPRIGFEKLRVFISLIEMAVIQAWALTISWQGERNGEEEHIRDVCKALAYDLYPKKLD